MITLAAKKMIAPRRVRRMSRTDWFDSLKSLQQHALMQQAWHRTFQLRSYASTVVDVTPSSMWNIFSLIEHGTYALDPSACPRFQSGRPRWKMSDWMSDTQICDALATWTAHLKLLTLSCLNARTR